MGQQRLGSRHVMAVFVVFALAYFLSALLRAVTATLAPTLSSELGLTASHLGLLAGGYFVGFAAMQLPLGRWLDRYGPKKVMLALLGVAVVGCATFAWATSLVGLWLARMLIGVGVAACLMAPLTGYRRWMEPSTQLRANSWMLMAGSFGMLASTLPVQWLMPLVGWRGVFWMIALAVLVCMLLIAWVTPRWQVEAFPGLEQSVGRDAGLWSAYREIGRHPYFRKMAWLGFVNYGCMLSIQTLWAGPWLVQVGGGSAADAASGLFGINFCMLVVFWFWGWLMPPLARRGVRVETLMNWGAPVSMGVLAWIVWMGSEAQWFHWALFCVLCTVMSLAQPAVAAAFPTGMAGRALSAYNLVIFGGVFSAQWLLGLMIDAFVALDWARPEAFRGAMAVYLVASVVAYFRFCSIQAHNRRP